jgi:hypothetical protein
LPFLLALAALWGALLLLIVALCLAARQGDLQQRTFSARRRRATFMNSLERGLTSGHTQPAIEARSWALSDASAQRRHALN